MFKLLTVPLQVLGTQLAPVHVEQQMSTAGVHESRALAKRFADQTVLDTVGLGFTDRSTIALGQINQCAGICNDHRAVRQLKGRTHKRKVDDRREMHEPIGLKAIEQKATSIASSW